MVASHESSTPGALLRFARITANVGPRLCAPAVGLYDGATCTTVNFSDTLDGISVASKDVNASRIILHFHGGGHCLGSAWSTREMIGRLSTATQARVISVNYRLAPENPFPAGHDDSLIAWRWVREQYPGASVAVAGDSAGGNLAFALLTKLAQLQEVQPVACIAMSPWLLMDPDAIGKRASNDQSRLRGMWNSGAARMVERYCQGHDTADPLVSPVLASDDLIQRFPPVMIHAAEEEPLAEDAREMAKLCERCGVVAKLELFPGRLHVFQVVPLNKASKESFQIFNAFLGQHWEPQIEE